MVILGVFEICTGLVHSFKGSIVLSIMYDVSVSTDTSAYPPYGSRVPPLLMIHIRLIRILGIPESFDFGFGHGNCLPERTLH